MAEALNETNGRAGTEGGIVNGVSEQSFARSRLAQQDHRHIRFRGQPRRAAGNAPCLIRRREVFEL